MHFIYSTPHSYKSFNKSFNSLFLQILRMGFLFVTFLFFGNETVFSQTFDEILKVVASDRNTPDFFGYSVSISGDHAVIGAYQNNFDAAGGNSSVNAGAAYFFERNGSGVWTQAQKVVASDREASDRFGRAVSLSGNFAIISAYTEDHDVNGNNFMSGAGSAYIFERNGSGNWIQVQKIVNPDRSANDRFGQSVSISGNYAIIGADQEDEDISGSNTLNASGSVYVFERNGVGIWNNIQKLIAADRGANDRFGYAISLSGDYAIIGAHQDDEDVAGINNINNSGSAYFFEKDGSGVWNQVQKIVASNRGDSDFFGWSVSLSGDYAVIGSYQEDEDGSDNNSLTDSGSAYVFERNGSGVWIQAQKIVASDRSISDYFGRSVSISGNHIVVGSDFEDEDTTGINTLNNSGSAYIFERDGGGNWNQLEKIVSSDRGENDLFGWSVSISGSNIIIGAYSEDEDALGSNTLSASGSAYIYEDTSTLGINDNKLPLEVNITSNPIKNNIQLQNISRHELESILIYDLSGKKVKTFSLIDLELVQGYIYNLNISKLASGMYIMIIQSNIGLKISKKLLKE